MKLGGEKKLGRTSEGEIEWARLPFDWPLWILFSSGTTGSFVFFFVILMRVWCVDDELFVWIGRPKYVFSSYADYTHKDLPGFP